MENNVLHFKGVRIKFKEIENWREFFFYGFVFCFVAAKAFGLDSGDLAYKVMAMAGVLLWMAVLYCTKFSRREYICILILIMFGSISLLLSGKLGVVLPFLLIAGSKDIRIEKLLKVIANVWIGVLLFKIFLALTGIVQNAAVAQGRLFAESAARYDMGYGHPNQFHVTVFIGITLFCYTHRELQRKHYAGLFLLNLAAFRLSYSTTGWMLTSLAIVGFGVIVYIENYYVNYHSISCILGILCALPMVISFLFAFIYKPGSTLWIRWNSFSTGRLYWNYLYVHQYSVPLFGQRFDGRISNLLDNAYLFTLYRYGAVVFGILMLGYILVLAKCIRKNEIRKIFFCLIFLMYGFAEQFIQNCFMNFSMFFLCELIWKGTKDNGED